MSNNNTSIHDFDFSFICNYFKLLKRQGPGSPEATRKAVSFINELTDDAKMPISAAAQAVRHCFWLTT